MDVRHPGPVERAQRLILPIGLPLALVLALLLPAPGQALGGIGVGPLSWSMLSVAVIFLINGLEIRFAGIDDPALARSAALVATLNLLVAPALAGVLLVATTWPLELDVGIAVMASVPTTLSSAAVIAINVGGDRLWALALTVSTVLLGSVTAPLAVSALLSSGIDISPVVLLRQVLLIVLVPTAIGVLLRKAARVRLPPVLSLVPSLAVVSVVWVTMSEQADAALSLEPVVVAGFVAVGVVGHLVLLGLGALAARGRPVAQAMPILFVTAQKTLPLALTILVILAEQSPQVAAAAAGATLIFVSWHFIQVFGDAVLSGRLAVRHASGLTAS